MTAFENPLQSDDGTFPFIWNAVVDQIAMAFDKLADSLQ